MTRSISVIAPLALVALPGCYLFHTDRGDPGVDAGPPPVEDGSMPTPRSDAGPPPLSCPPVRASASCFESFLVEPGRGFSLPIAIDTCACCPETQCAVVVDRPTRTLLVATALCPDRCDCVACNDARGSCEVPPLEEGMWRVVVNGVPAFELPVLRDSGVVPPPPTCATYAEEDRCDPGSPALPGRPLSRPAICAEPQVVGDGQLDEITVWDGCWGCGELVSTCYGSVYPRTTDDLPPGGEIHLDLRTYESRCEIECPAICVPRGLRCVVPALRRGDYYRVHLDGRVIASFVAGEPMPCAIPAEGP